MLRVSDRPVLVASGVGLLCLCVALVAANSGSTPLKPAAQGQPQLPRPFRADGSPCASGGSKVALAAVANSSTPILMPNHALANEASVASTWVCGDGVILMFESGIRIIAQPDEIGGSSGLQFASRAARHPESHSVGSLRANPALWVDPDAVSARQKGGVEWVEGRWRYWLAGEGQVSLNELRAVADTLAEYN
jgi:hypothetical protein